jgi:MFS family permease
MSSSRGVQMGPGLWIEPASASPSPEAEPHQGDSYFGLTPIRNPNKEAAGPSAPGEASPSSSGAVTPDECESNPASPDPYLYEKPVAIAYADREAGASHADHASAAAALNNEVADTGEYIAPGETILELGRVRSRRLTPMPELEKRPTNLDRIGTKEGGTINVVGLADEGGSPNAPVPARLSQGVPPELPNLAAELVFVFVCSFGQIAFAMSLGHVMVPQHNMREALGLEATQTPWLLGAAMLASALSVIISGSLADLARPKPLMVGAFIWQAVWNAISAVSITPERKILFFVARAMHGLALGVIVSASMSVLGRIYNPGIRKTRVFSFMGATSPVGFWLGCITSGGLSDRMPWIFGIMAIMLGVCAVAAQLTLPDLRPAADYAGVEAPSLRQFDWLGASVASVGCALLILGLTQGSSAHWSPYTYTVIIIGALCFIAFAIIEGRVARPLIPNGLWKTPGFAAILVSFFLGFGGFGAWQFYAIQFWQRYQGASTMTTALYFLPNGVGGVLAAGVVSLALHRWGAHYIFAASMICYALAPVFFLPQTPDTSYWALSMPGVFISCFGPDMCFAAAAIFITSAVPRSYQGSAGSLLVTVQNLSSAIATATADSIGVRVDQLPSGEVGLAGIRACWWFSLGCSIAAFIITVTFVRIPKQEEKEHTH